MKNYIILLYLLLICSIGYSQNYLGAQVGYFQYQYKSYSQDISFIQSGIRFEKKFANKGAISIEELVEKSTITFYSKKSATYLKTVISLDLNIGNKMYWLLGVGVAPKLLIQNIDYESDPKLFVLDGKLNMGIGYHLSSKFFTSLSCQYHFNITPYNIYNYPDHFGGSTPYSEYEQHFFLQLNLNYRINLDQTDR